MFLANKEIIKIEEKNYTINYDNGVIIDFEDVYGYSITKELSEMIEKESQKATLKLLSVMLREENKNEPVGLDFIRNLTPIIYEKELDSKMGQVIIKNMPKDSKENKKK